MRRVRDRADRSRRHGAASFHQRNDRPAEGRGPRPWRDRGAPRHRPVGARFQARRYFLVHRRPGMGDGNVLRNPVAAHEWNHEPHRRGRVRRRALVPHHSRPARVGLVHRADRDPHDDEGRNGRRAQVRPVVAAVLVERRRAPQSGSGRVERKGVRSSVPRQLVADGDRRHHDRQLRRHGHQARLHGQAAAGDRGGHRRAPAPTAALAWWRRPTCRASWRSSPDGRR